MRQLPVTVSILVDGKQVFVDKFQDALSFAGWLFAGWHDVSRKAPGHFTCNQGHTTILCKL